MSQRSGRIRVLLAVVVALLILPGCAAPIPREDVPAGWALNVHQPGEWWTQPLIPRSVVVKRCPPPHGWASEPDLTKVTALPPGSEVNYYRWTDDYHCSIGWSEPPSEVELSADEMSSETGLRRICSSSGLPMDASWRFLGDTATVRAGSLPYYPDDDELTVPRGATASFIDDYGTVVGCIMGGNYGGAFVELSAGAGPAKTTAAPACPVTARDLARADDDTVSEYRLRGAGAVLDGDGRVLTEARTLRIGLAGDSVTTSHPVVDGIAIVDAWVTPKATIPLDWDNPPPVEGQVLGADGSVSATCRG